MSWKDQIKADTPGWLALLGYIEHRLGELTAICVASSSDDRAIRAAQSGIEELQRLKALPQTIQTSSAERLKTRRKEY